MEIDKLNLLLSESINELRNGFTGSANTSEFRACVEQILPIPNDSLKILDVEGCQSKFRAKIECKFTTPDEVDNFIEKYNNHNSETLRLSSMKTLSEKSPYITARYMRCHHNTRYAETMSPAEVLSLKPCKRIKNTNCPFSMVIKLSKNPSLCDTLINLEWNHNHAVTSLQSLSFRDIPKEVTEQIQILFKAGMLPGSAHREFMRQLKSECKSDLEYHKKLADRALVPRRNDFNNLYNEYNKKHYGTASLATMFATLKERTDSIKDNSGYRCAYQEFSEERNQPESAIYNYSIDEQNP